MSEKKIEELINSGSDLYGRDYTFEFKSDLSLMPELVKKNRGEWESLIKS